MIDYGKDLLAGDLTFYWQESVVFYRHAKYGYLPVYLSSTEGIAPYVRRSVNQVPDDGYVTLTFLKNVAQCKLGRKPTGLTPLNVHPSKLYDDDDSFVTYHPYGGVVEVQGNVLMLSCPVTRSRNKGVSLRYATRPLTRCDRYDTNTLALAGFCKSLDGPEFWTKENIKAALVGDGPPVVHNRCLWVTTGGRVFVNRQRVGTLTLEGDDVCVHLDQPNDALTGLVEAALEGV